MKKELTTDNADWVDLKNELFKVGDIIIAHERIVVEARPNMQTENVGKVLAEKGDELTVVGVDCIGAFVQNKTRPELNFEVPDGVPEDMHRLYNCWMCRNINATLIRENP